MEKNISKALLIKCEVRGQIQRVWRHIPGGEEHSRAKKYGKESVLSVEDGRHHLIEAVKNGKPYMAARFGTSEGAAFYEYWKTALKMNVGGV